VKIRKHYYTKRLIPIIPKSRRFKRGLRNELVRSWNYASHYIDSAININEEWGYPEGDETDDMLPMNLEGAGEAVSGKNTLLYPWAAL